MVIDWDKLEAEYITSEKSYHDLARENSLSCSNLSRYGKAHDWTGKRKKYRKSIADKMIRNDRKRKENQLLRVGNAAEALIGRVEKMLDDHQQFNRHLVTMTLRDEDGTNVTTTEERVFSKADTKAMKDIAGTLKELTGIMRNVYGLPTQAESEAQRIAAERLKMEQEKAKREEEQGKSQVLEVRFESGLEELAE